MYNEITSNKRKTAVLVAVFFALLLAIGYAFSLYSGESPVITMGFAGLISTVMALVGYYSGDSIALSSAGAKQISKESNAYLYNMVENLCITAGMKTIPRVFVIEDPSINAFATGRDPEHSSIAVTTGAIQLLENEELEGVLAHELAHIKNYDIRLMTIVIVLIGSIALLSDMMRFSSFRKSDDRESGPPWLALIGFLLIILSPIIAEMIKLAISRKREFLADATGSLLTRYPEGLARALEKIRDNNRPLTHANHATAHLYFENPFRTAGKKASSFFSTHPPIEERIAALRGMTSVK